MPCLIKHKILLFVSPFLDDLDTHMSMFLLCAICTVEVPLEATGECRAISRG